MPRFRVILPLVVTCSLATFLAPSNAASDDTCNQRFTEPSTGTVTVQPAQAVPGTAMELELMPTGNTDAMMWDTVVFHVDGPAGASDLHGDRYASAQYTPPQEGRYSVSATWTRVDCADIGRQTTTGGSAPATPFDVVHGKRPGASFWTTKRPRHKAARIPGDASLHVQLACPADDQATRETFTIYLYWTTNGRPATHQSKRVWTRGDGCYARKFPRSKDFLSKLVNAGAAGTGAFIDVFEPARADVLVEVRSGGALVAAKRAKLRRSSTGMGITVSGA